MIFPVEGTRSTSLTLVEEIAVGCLVSAAGICRGEVRSTESYVKREDGVLTSRGVVHWSTSATEVCFANGSEGL
jgi:hypothetical protein